MDLEIVKQINKDIPVREPYYVKLSNLEKGINKRNRRLQDSKLRRLHTNNEEEELSFCWTSDPDRQGKQIFDSGEVIERNTEYEQTAVQRIFIWSVESGKRSYQSVLVRVKTGRPVAWNNDGKWIDIETDEKYIKLIKQVLASNGTNREQVEFCPKKEKVTIQEFQDYLEQNNKKMPDWQMQDSFYGKHGEL